ncbi:NAD-binding protein [Candidatus Woesearchaeota archaeon]|nr:NAD-binding protein [Candidatus Woesearchaeota archaeon]
MKVVIVGAGESGRTLANMLSSENQEVSLIEKEEKIAEDTAKEIDALVIKGDATEYSILKDAGIEKADAVIALTDDDKTNLMVCEIAKSSKITKILSRVNSPKNEELFTKLGITSVVPLVSLEITKIKNMLEPGRERVIAELGEGDVQVIEATLGEKSRLIGRDEASIKGAVIGAIYREGDIVIPEKGAKLKEGDVLVIIAKSKGIDKITKLISGE